MQNLELALSNLSVRTDSTRKQISDLADKLNTITQVLGYKKPVRYEYTCQAQLIPIICIGKVRFIARNWLVSRDEKLITLYKYIIANLNDSQFILKHSEDLASHAITSESVFTDPDTTPIIAIDEIKLK